MRKHIPGVKVSKQVEKTEVPNKEEIRITQNLCKNPMNHKQILPDIVQLWAQLLTLSDQAQNQ